MTAIIRISPTRAMTVVEPFYRPMSFLDEFETLARELWDSWPVGGFRTSFTFGLDMYEEKDELVVKAELPGIKKEHLDISLEGGILAIKAEKEPEAVAEEAAYYHCERSFGQYYRSVSLPFHVDADRVSATFENGLLEIRLPKAAEAKSRHIEVKVGSPRPKRLRVAKSK